MTKTWFFEMISLALIRDWMHSERASCDRPWNVAFCNTVNVTQRLDVSTRDIVYHQCTQFTYLLQTMSSCPPQKIIVQLQ